MVDLKNLIVLVLTPLLDRRVAAASADRVVDLKNLILLINHPASQSLGTPPIQEGSFVGSASSAQIPANIFFLIYCFRDLFGGLRGDGVPGVGDDQREFFQQNSVGERLHPVGSGAWENDIHEEAHVIGEAPRR